MEEDFFRRDFRLHFMDSLTDFLVECSVDADVVYGSLKKILVS